jgi:FLVCR family feline leukemia virus subgroup C receptor-related protein
MNTLNPIAAELSFVYDYKPIVVNLGNISVDVGGLLYMLMHPIFTFPAAYVIDSKGARAGIILGSILGILGVTMRLFVNHGFWLVLVGQILAGIGRPFIMNCQAKISANWFHASIRVLSNKNIGWSDSINDASCEYITSARYSDTWNNV